MPLLPPELWLEIFACADSLTLASVTRVNSTYKRLAESSLYRNVSLSSEKDGIERFAQSLAACPSHAALVQHLDIVAINLHEATISIHAYGILKRCRELRSITITIVAHCRPCAVIDWARYEQHAFNGDYPHLRRLKTNLDNAPTFLIDFFRRHPNIDELDLQGVPKPDSHLPHKSLSSLSEQLPSVRYLTSPGWVLLSSGFTAPPQLTHVSVPSFYFPHLSRLLDVLGPRLVSLKLGTHEWNGDYGAPMFERSTVSFSEVCAKLPSLKLLQVYLAEVRRAPISR